MDLVEVMCGADPVSGAVQHPDIRIRLRRKSGGPDIARVDVHEVYPGEWSHGVFLPGYGRAPCRRHGVISKSREAAIAAGFDEISHRIAGIVRAADVCSSDRELADIKSWVDQQKLLTGHKI